MQTCPQCGAGYLPNTLYCETCGMALYALHSAPEAPPPAPEPGSGPLRSLQLEVADTGRTAELQLGAEAILLGRSDPNSTGDLALDLAEDGGLEKGVSRRHVRLTLKGNDIFIEDLNSANGTWVNDVRLSVNQPFPLRHGDLIQLGRLSMRANLLAGHR